MANVAALRKKAADFEQKKQLDKAIAAYREILDVFDTGAEDYVDVGLYNRVGDLLVRQGNTPDAVTLYERAVDLYAEGGFFNNAIALCNKILRTSPGRATVYYKLGKISAAKGFNGDAKSNFLEYADRMQKSGKMEEAFRALKEFADLCPDQDDIRLMLAEQLTKADRKGEALEQLQLLHARYDAAGRAAEAQATFDRMRALDPNAEAKSDGGGKRAKNDDLVFIDLDAPTPRAGRLTRGISTKIDIAPPPVAPPIPEPPPVAHVTPRAAAPISAAILGLESTSLGGAEIIVEPAPLPASEFAAIDLSAIPEAPTGPQPSPSNLALPGDLPMIDLDGTPVEGIFTIEAEAGEAGTGLGLPMLDIEDAHHAMRRLMKSRPRNRVRASSRLRPRPVRPSSSSTSTPTHQASLSTPGQKMRSKPSSRGRTSPSCSPRRTDSPNPRLTCPSNSRTPGAMRPPTYLPTFRRTHRLKLRLTHRLKLRLKHRPKHWSKRRPTSSPPNLS